PYGLDALNTLRIEKGHVTSAELNGNTSADDLGLERLLKPRGDFIGRALSQRPGLAAPDRLQLVGVRPVDRTLPLRNGLQLLDPAGRAASLRYVTSATPSVELRRAGGLPLVARGRGPVSSQSACGPDAGCCSCRRIPRARRPRSGSGHAPGWRPRSIIPRGSWRCISPERSFARS